MTTGNNLIDEVVNTEKPLAAIFEQVSTDSYPAMLEAITNYTNQFARIDSNGAHSEQDKPLMPAQIKMRVDVIGGLLNVNAPINERSVALQQTYIQEIAKKAAERNR